jgi:hypothetical protein
LVHAHRYSPGTPLSVKTCVERRAPANRVRSAAGDVMRCRDAMPEASGGQPDLLGDLHCAAHPLCLPRQHHQPRLDHGQRVQRAARHNPTLSTPPSLAFRSGPSTPAFVRCPLGIQLVSWVRRWCAADVWRWPCGVVSRAAGNERHDSGEEPCPVDEELGLVKPAPDTGAFSRVRAAPIPRAPWSHDRRAHLSHSTSRSRGMASARVAG